MSSGPPLVPPIPSALPDGSFAADCSAYVTLYENQNHGLREHLRALLNILAAKDAEAAQYSQLLDVLSAEAEPLHVQLAALTEQLDCIVRQPGWPGWNSGPLQDPYHGPVQGSPPLPETQRGCPPPHQPAPPVSPPSNTVLSLQQCLGASQPATERHALATEAASWDRSTDALPRPGPPLPRLGSPAAAPWNSPSVALPPMTPTQGSPMLQGAFPGTPCRMPPSAPPAHRAPGHLHPDRSHEPPARDALLSVGPPGQQSIAPPALPLGVAVPGLGCTSSPVGDAAGVLAPRVGAL